MQEQVKLKGFCSNLSDFSMMIVPFSNGVDVHVVFVVVVVSGGGRFAVAGLMFFQWRCLGSIVVLDLKPLVRNNQSITK